MVTMVDEIILKKQLSSIQNKITFETVQSFIVQAERWFKKEFGTPLYGFVSGLAVPSGVLTDDELRDLSEALISWKCLELSYPHLKFRIGDLGMMKAIPQNHVSITKWEYTDSQNGILAMQDLLLEAIYEHLEAYRPAVWTAEPAYAKRQQYFIRSATELTAILPLAKGNTRFFSTLAAYIKRAESLYLEPAIGMAEWNVLKTIWNNAANPSWPDPSPYDPEQVRLIELIQEAIAHLALYEAYPYLPLIIDEEGIRQPRYKDGTREEEFAEPNLRNTQRRQLWHDGHRLMTQAQNYMKAVASATVFPLYFNILQASLPDTESDYDGLPHCIL